MTFDRNRRDLRADYGLAAALLVAGLALLAASSPHLELRDHPRVAQNTQPQSPSNGAEPQVPAGNPQGPAPAEPGGTRPTTPPPEPARPDADAQKAGAKPALPPAPAEKMGEPVQKK